MKNNKPNIFQRVSGWVSSRIFAKVSYDELILSQLGDFLGSFVSKSGISINARTAMNITFVFQCVQVLRQVVAQIPLLTMRRLKNGGKERAVDHPLFDLLFISPDSSTPISIFQFKQMIMTSLLLVGNFYAFITRRPGSGEVINLLPLNNARVTPRKDEKTGKKVFDIEMDGKIETRPASDILHIMDYTNDGIVGISRIAQNRDGIGLSKQAENFASAFFANGAAPGVGLTTEKVLGQPGIDRLLEQIEEKHTQTGGGSWQRPFVFEDGLKWTVPDIPTDDIQFLAMRKFQKTEMAGIFRVPPHMIGDLDNANLSNVENLTLSFVTINLMPNLVNIENEMLMQLIPRSQWSEFVIEFLVASLLRGDTLSRYKAYQIGILTGFMNRNQARIMENWNPEEGLSEFLVPMNVATIDKDGNQTIMTVGSASDMQRQLLDHIAQMNN